MKKLTFLQKVLTSTFLAALTLLSTTDVPAGEAVLDRLVGPTRSGAPRSAPLEKTIQRVTCSALPVPAPLPSRPDLVLRTEKKGRNPGEHLGPVRAVLPSLHPKVLKVHETVLKLAALLMDKENVSPAHVNQLNKILEDGEKALRAAQTNRCCEADQQIKALHGEIFKLAALLMQKENGLSASGARVSQLEKSLQDGETARRAVQNNLYFEVQRRDDQINRMAAEILNLKDEISGLRVQGIQQRTRLDGVIAHRHQLEKKPRGFKS